MRVALYVALFLCVVLLSMGIGIWWITIIPGVLRLLLSILCSAPAIAYGAIIIEELRD